MATVTALIAWQSDRVFLLFLMRRKERPGEVKDGRARAGNVQGKARRGGVEVATSARRPRLAATSRFRRRL